MANPGSDAADRGARSAIFESAGALCQRSTAKVSAAARGVVERFSFVVRGDDKRAVPIARLHCNLVAEAPTSSSTADGGKLAELDRARSPRIASTAPPACRHKSQDGSR